VILRIRKKGEVKRRREEGKRKEQKGREGK
jgi:hypothetical protein